jgi:hypothetical protein
MKLSSPRHDATQVQEFLTRLGFNVKVVLDEQATREGIFRTLSNHLLENTSIKPGDPIVIYYAGHGTVYPANRFRHRDRGYVEAILPIDRDEQLANGERIPDIYDFELWKFLRQLNEKRTRNVTFISDCCHSGGATRSWSESAVSQREGNGSFMQVRRTGTVTDIPSYIKELYCSERDLVLQSKEDTITHVHIAACQDYESAWGNRNEGMFTKLLLCQFDELPLMITSYEQLEETFRDQLPRQHPVIYGRTDLKRCLLFQIVASP